MRSVPGSAPDSDRGAVRLWTSPRMTTFPGERMTMRTTLAPLLTLLTPVLAFAQAPLPGPIEQEVSRSPAFWYWIVLLAVAAVAFAWSAVRISRRRRGPPTGPGTGTGRGPRTPRTPRTV